MHGAARIRFSYLSDGAPHPTAIRSATDGGNSSFIGDDDDLRLVSLLAGEDPIRVMLMYMHATRTYTIARMAKPTLKNRRLSLIRRWSSG
jgi:hypothetical protein